MIKKNKAGLKIYGYSIFGVTLWNLEIKIFNDNRSINNISPSPFDILTTPCHIFHAPRDSSILRNSPALIDPSHCTDNRTPRDTSTRTHLTRSTNHLQIFLFIERSSLPMCILSLPLSVLYYPHYFGWGVCLFDMNIPLFTWKRNEYN